MPSDLVTAVVADATHNNCHACDSTVCLVEYVNKFSAPDSCEWCGSDNTQFVVVKKCSIVDCESDYHMRIEGSESHVYEMGDEFDEGEASHDG